jgi:MYXO-CTERM domain-containing protein
VGGAQRITLKGDNPPVYRGAMDFTDNKATKRKGPRIENVSAGLDGGEGQVAANDSPAAAPMSTDVAPIGSAPTMVPSNAYNRTAEEEAVQDHPKGCGCKAAGMDRSSTGAAAAAMLALGLAIAWRRRP